MQEINDKINTFIARVLAPDVHPESHYYWNELCDLWYKG